MNKILKPFKVFFSVIFSKRFLIYTLIGSFNTFNCVLFSTLLEWARVQENLAFAIGYICSLTIAYIFNSIFNFKRKLTFLRYGKFLASYIPNFAIQNLVTFICFNIIDMHHVFAYIIAALLGSPITFICLKLFAFGDKRQKQSKIWFFQ